MKGSLFISSFISLILGRENISKLRSIFYPPINLSDYKNFNGTVVRCGEHSDYGTITFLYQDSMGGLEVRAVDNSWIRATLTASSSPKKNLMG